MQRPPEWPDHSHHLGVRAQLRRVAQLLLAASLLAIADAPVAAADAAGPTDYRTDIVSVDPQTAAIGVEMIGGDSFIGLEQLEPVEIVVFGYQGEPYLRFQPDGRVFENRRSPSKWRNEDRYGTDKLPSFADPDASPEWIEVADDGRYAWHDHRSHWMQSVPPAGAEPDDQVLESVIPLQINGEAVKITVASYLLAGPSPIPAIVGIVAAVAAAAAVFRSGRVARLLPAAGIAAAALVLGRIAYRSVPSETQPSALLWLLPLVALLAALFVVVVRNRLATTVYLDGLATTAGAVLAYWGITRFDALQRALIPSDAPASIDRLVIAASLVAGSVIAVQGTVGLFNPKKLSP